MVDEHRLSRGPCSIGPDNLPIVRDPVSCCCVGAGEPETGEMKFDLAQSAARKQRHDANCQTGLVHCSLLVIRTLPLGRWTKRLLLSMESWPTNYPSEELDAKVGPWGYGSR